MINTTVIHVEGQDPIQMPGMDMDMDTAAASMNAAFNTASMSKREEVIDGVRHIYFTRRTGTKGAVNTTVIHVEGQDPISMPGMDMDMDTAAASMNAAFNTASMSKRDEVVDGVRHIYFTRRTGTKG